MTTNADIAAQLLMAAAKFFRDVAGENPAVRDQMMTNADTYDAVAEMVRSDPMGMTDLDGEAKDETAG